MAPTAYVLYNADATKKAQKGALEAVRNVQGVEYAHPTDGVYDGIAKITENTMDKLKERTAAVRRLDTVSTTLTMIKIEG